jgi:hypothetical protein
MAAADRRAVFEFHDGALSEAAPEVVGLWETVPSASPPGLVFAATATTSLDAPVWRVNLPADLSRAAAHLASGEARLRESRQALATAADRLQAFTQAQRMGVAFGVGPAEPALPQPEAELLVWLQGREAGRRQVSFGLGDEVTSEWERVTQQVQRIVERLLQLVAHYAWVETHLQERLVGRTAVSWTGDVHTVWSEPISAAHAALHQRALAVALASRDTLLRTFALAARGALTLSILLGTPGGAVLALPAAWRFINQVLAEVGHHQDTIKEPPHGY